MDWQKFIPVAIAAAITLYDKVKQNQPITAENDAAIAAAALKLLDRTETGRKLREHLDSLGDEEASQLWDRMVEVGP